MNWGNKLIIVFLVFGGMMGYLVYRCIGSPVNLVSKEYYKEELMYQQVIDGKTRANALDMRVSARQEAGHLLICLPHQDSITGTAWLYCASDAGNDRQFALNLGGNNCHTQPVPAPGIYTVKVRWKSKGSEYFSEQELTIR